jgi:hypothetical protein
LRKGKGGKPGSAAAAVNTRLGRTQRGGKKSLEASAPKRIGRARPGSLADDDSFEDDENELLPEAPKKRWFPFTIAGALLGVVIGFGTIKVSNERKLAADAEAKERVENDIRQTLAQRKKLFSDELAGRQKTVQDFLTRVQSREANTRQAMVENAIETNLTNPQLHLLIAEFVKVWTPPNRETPLEAAESDKIFTQQLAEAEKLAASGKPGLALLKIRENEKMLEARHGKEIDARITKWSDELTARWEKTKEEVETLTRAQEGEKAVETLREALVYGEGDGAIEREVGRLLPGLQAITTLQATSAERDASSDAPRRERSSQQTPAREPKRTRARRKTLPPRRLRRRSKGAREARTADRSELGPAAWARK